MWVKLNMITTGLNSQIIFAYISCEQIRRPYIYAKKSYPDRRHLGLFGCRLRLLRTDTVNCGTKGLTVVKPRPLFGEAGEGLSLIWSSLLLLELGAGYRGGSWTG